MQLYLRSATEKDAKLALDEEMAGARRRTLLLRIHARFNRLRGDREREQLRDCGTRAR